MHFALDTKSETALVDIFKGSPLSSIASSPTTGNVAAIFDCNSYGEATSRPSQRKCPLPSSVLKKLFGALYLARYDSLTPDALPKGDIFCFVDAGKDRKRQFQKVINKTTSTDKAVKNRLRTLVLHASESSMKLNKPKRRILSLTQQMHMIHSGQTEFRRKEYKVFMGSNSTDLFGPMEMPKYVDLPKLSQKDKRAWWGKERMLEVGGQVSLDI